jgi:hypothetical protein
MPIIQLSFPNPLNVSVQKGDIAYFSNPTPVGPSAQWAATVTPHLTNDQQDIIKIGEIQNIIKWNGTYSAIICNMSQILFNQYFPLISTVDPKSFIMFSKDNKVNMASILGYYASVEFRNSSTIKSEIFNVGTKFFESSK